MAKIYTLYAKIAGSRNSKYSFEESLREDSKRQQVLMSGSLIEELDRLTAKYESIEDLLVSYPEEVWDTKINLYDLVIIVDKDKVDRSKSYYISDIVFARDAKELENRDNIKCWLLDYLMKNHGDIKEFRGIRDIYKILIKSYSDYSISNLINMTVLVYFKDNNYKRYREAYFKLRELDYKRVKKK